jgi:simple sugar transport system permease protein
MRGAKQKTWPRLRQSLHDNMDLVRLGLITLLIFVGMGVLRPNLFLSSNNFVSMAFQFPEFAILALAMMLAMLSGGIDLSIIGIMNLSAILAGLLLTSLTANPAAAVGPSIALIIVVALVAGTLCGLINGLLIAKVGIPPILATLGTSQVYLGIAIVVTGGAAVHGFPEAFDVIGSGSLAGIPVPLLLFAVLALGVAVLLNKTPYGAKLYMLGTNPLAARFAGLDNPRLLILTYTLSGVLCSVAGILIMSRANSIRADFGASYLLLTILVAVLGGINPYGGFGKVAGLVLAVLAMQFLSSGFNLLRVSNFAREFVWGALLLGVMVLTTLSQWRRGKPKPVGEKSARRSSA